MTADADERAKLLAIGFWSNSVRPDYPTAQSLVGPLEVESERSKVVAYLRSGSVVEVWRGWSHCRFECGMPDEQMGHADLSDGSWVWPEGLAHYVEQHGVALPAEFVRHARSADFVCRTASKGRFRYDDETWLKWARERGRQQGGEM